jgi:hypothetical protein
MRYAMDISLRVQTNHSFEMNFHPSLFQLRILEADDKGVTMTLLNNEASQILKEGMRCILEYPNGIHRSLDIKTIADVDGFRKLACSVIQRSGNGHGPSVRKSAPMDLHESAK